MSNFENFDNDELFEYALNLRMNGETEKAIDFYLDIIDKITPIIANIAQVPSIII